MRMKIAKVAEIPYSDVPIIEINTIGSNKGTMKIRNLKGLESIIDFSGDKVTFSRDLPVDETARIFFEAVGDYFRTNSPNWLA